MRKPKFNPSYPTTPILIFLIFVGLFNLALGIDGIFIMRHALETGRSYTLGIILNDNTMVGKSDSPMEYWALLIFMSITIIGCIGLGILIPINVTLAYIKKLARQKKGNADLGAGHH